LRDVGSDQLCRVGAVGARHVARDALRRAAIGQRIVVQGVVEIEEDGGDR